ncbi:hypothetical protein T439DRAFT_377001 [Meredithblackwellia eburnea MCA 4105]
MAPSNPYSALPSSPTHQLQIRLPSSFSSESSSSTSSSRSSSTSSAYPLYASSAPRRPRTCLPPKSLITTSLGVVALIALGSVFAATSSAPVVVQHRQMVQEYILGAGHRLKSDWWGEGNMWWNSSDDTTKQEEDLTAEDDPQWQQDQPSQLSDSDEDAKDETDPWVSDDVSGEKYQEEVSTETSRLGITTVPCTAALLDSFQNPTFWLVRELSPLNYEVGPRDLSAVPEAPCLSDAIFAARLVSVSSSTRKPPLVIKSLPSPVLPEETSKPGFYPLLIPTNLAIPEAEYTLEVRLDFGSLPGAKKGNVCGVESENCSGELLPEGDYYYVGQKIEVEGGGRVSLGMAGTDLKTTVNCKNFSPFEGYWQGQTFHPTPPSEEGHPSPCNLFTPTFPVPFARSASSSNTDPTAGHFYDEDKDDDESPTQPSTPIWIHLIGDSNMRNLHSAFAASFGEGGGETYWESGSPVKNGTVSAISFRYSSGSSPATTALLATEDPDVIVTWQWWHATAHDFDDNAAELAWWTNGTLGEFVKRSHLRDSLNSFGKQFRSDVVQLRPTRTYITLGSHSEDLTAARQGELLDIYFGAGEDRDENEAFLSPEVMELANVKYFTVTEVQSRNIPLDRFPKQDLVRNNAVIEAKNELLRARKELEGRILDVEKLTRGITETYMKVGKKPDAVHFLKFVYHEWARMIWTDLAA